MADSGKNQNNPDENDEDNAAPEEQQSLSFFQMIGSVLSSFFGIQSSAKSKRDFKHGKASQFIAIGILITLVWYGVISLIVNVVLSNR